MNGGENLLEMGVAADDSRKHLDGPFAAQHIHRVAYCQHLATQLLLVFPFDKTNDKRSILEAAPITGFGKPMGRKRN